MHAPCVSMPRRPPRGPRRGEGLATVRSGNARSRNPRAYERMAHPQHASENTVTSDRETMKTLARARPADPPDGLAPTGGKVRMPYPTSVPGPSAKEEGPTCSWWRSNDKG